MLHRHLVSSKPKWRPDEQTHGLSRESTKIEKKMGTIYSDDLGLRCAVVQKIFQRKSVTSDCST